VCASKKRKVERESQRHTWATKFPWIELVMGANGKLHHVWCKICTDIEHKEKLLVLKLDNLHKHSIRKKCKHVRPR